jgi:hypothetical protein
MILKEIFNMNMVERIFRLNKDELKSYMDKYFKSLGYKTENKDGFLYCPGTIPILLVAHLDTVHKYPVYDLCKSNTGVWMSPQGIGGDDRCGVYAIARIVRKYHCHVILCEEEETGCKGAKKFTQSSIKPEVNYIIEIDRKGCDDAVYYDCDNKEFEKFVTDHGFKTQTGSCSDISDIAPYLGVAAVNLSSGYYNAHTISEFVVFDDLEKTINRVYSMLSDDVVTKYKYVKKEYKYSHSNYYGKLYDYSKWNKNHKTEKSDKKDKILKAVTVVDEKSLDIIWLCEEQYFTLQYNKTAGTEGYCSCDGYGVDIEGNVYRRLADGTINMVEEVVFVNEFGYRMYPKGIFLRESYWRENIEKDSSWYYE